MKTLKRILISTALLALPLSAMADNDGRGHGRGHGHGKHVHKHVHKHYYDRHDHRGHHGHRPHFRHHEHHVYHHHRDHGRPVRHERVYVPAVVYAPVAYPQGVTIHGNVHFPF